MSYHIISYHIISYHIISCHIISCHIMSYHITSYIWFRFLSCPISELVNWSVTKLFTLLITLHCFKILIISVSFTMSNTGEVDAPYRWTVPPPFFVHPANGITYDWIGLRCIGLHCIVLSYIVSLFVIWLSFIWNSFQFSILIITSLPLHHLLTTSSSSRPLYRLFTTSSPPLHYLVVVGIISAKMTQQVAVSISPHDASVYVSQAVCAIGEGTWCC